MANIFDTSSSVAAVTQNQTPIQQPVQDNTTAQAIESVANLAYKVGGDIISEHVVQSAMDVAGLDAEGKVKNIFVDQPEAAEEAEIPQEAKNTVNEMSNRLDAIRKSVQAGGSQNKAEIRARMEVNKAMSAYPMYSEQIKRRASQYGLIGGLSGVGATRTAQKTPEQKAQEAYLQEVNSLALKAGISEEAAANLIQQNAYYDQKEKNAQSNTGRIYTSSNKAQNDIYSQVILPIIKHSPGGNITPEIMQEGKFAIRQAGNDWYMQEVKKAEEGGYLTKSYQDELAATRDELISTNVAMIEEKSLSTLLSTNRQVAESIVAIDNAKTKYLSGLVSDGAINNDEFKTIVMASGGDEKALKSVQDNARLSEVFGINDNIQHSLANAKVDAGIKLMTGSSPSWDANHSGVDESGQGVKHATQSRTTPTQQDQAFGLLLNSKDGPRILQSSLDKDANNTIATFKDVAKSDPRSITLLTQPRTMAVIKNDKKGPELVDTTIKNAGRSFAASMYADGWDGQIKISMYTEGPYGVKVKQQSPVISGIPETPQSANYRKQIQNMIKAAVAYPEVWKGKYPSALAYVEDSINMSIGKTEEERIEARTRARLAKEEADEADREAKEKPAQDAIDFLTHAKTARKQAKPNSELVNSVQGLAESGYSREEVMEDFDQLASESELSPTKVRAQRKALVAALDQVYGPEGNDTAPTDNVGTEPTIEGLEAGVVRDLQVLKDSDMTDEEIIQFAKEKGWSDERISLLEKQLGKTRLTGEHM